MLLIRTKRYGFAAALVASVALLAGCGGSARLEGTVTLDGQPVDGGTIAFTPAGGQKSNLAGRIANGKYVIENAGTLAPGTYKVEINWPKKTGNMIPNKNDPGTQVDEVKQAIPMEYNTQSKLTAELKSGVNTNNFELKSGGAIDTRPIGSAPPRSKASGDN
ncbi:hypothetical protein [Fimbriiglobus ruber]|nr:hypothetical protein [Fimbriiglobus ruber]